MQHSNTGRETALRWTLSKPRLGADTLLDEVSELTGISALRVAAISGITKATPVPNPPNVAHVPMEWMLCEAER